MKEQFHLKNGQLQRTLNYRWLRSLCNTWNYLQGTRFRQLSDIFKYRQKQDMVGAFLKKTNKGLDISLRLGLSSFYACIKKKVKIHATIFNSPTFKQKFWEEWEPLVSTAGVQHPPGSLGHQFNRVRDREEPVGSHSYTSQPCAAGG